MLFAAGLGTRMGALTADRPKPLIEVAGRPLAAHALALAREAGVGRIVANLHYRAEMLRPWLEREGVAVSDESARLLDTGGGLKAARPLLGPGPVFTLNTDAVWRGPNPLDLLAAAWAPERMDALLLCLPPERARSHRGPGDFALGEDGRLSRGGPLVFSGAEIIAADRLDEVEQAVFSLNQVWDAIAAEGRLFGVAYPGEWCDVGRPEGIAEAERMLGGG